MKNATELEILADVAGRLEAAGIDYMLTGSLAMSYYATPRMTRDIDIVVALDAQDGERIRQIFRGDYYLPEDSLRLALATQGMFNLVHLESVAKVDIIVRKDQEFRQVEFARRRRVAFAGIELWMTSLEDLVLSKLVWAKPSHSELQLRDIKSLLESGADLGYLRQWAPQLGVADLLEECLDA